MQNEKYLVYLPEEGLQGEGIPSNITWDNINVQSIVINFEKPFQVKSVFNASNPVITDNELVVKNIEVDGYLGLLFGTSKIEETEKDLLIKYTLRLTDGKTIKVEKNIKMFKPQLSVKPPSGITVEHKNGFVKGRLSVKNTGRGLLLIQIKNTQDSACKIKTPQVYQDVAEKISNDLTVELSNLAETFPQFKPYNNYLGQYFEKTYFDLTDKEKEEIEQKVYNLKTLFASDKALLEAFVEACVKVILRNRQIQETFRRLIMIYESSVTENILLLNPLDELLLEQKENKIKIVITLTDSIYDNYENIELSEIIIKAEPNTRVPIYKLINWR